MADISVSATSALQLQKCEHISHIWPWIVLTHCCSVKDDAKRVPKAMHGDILLECIKHYTEFVCMLDGPYPALQT